MKEEQNVSHKNNMTTIEELKKTLLDHEKRITKLELKAKASQIMRDPHLQKVLDNLLKGVEEQNARRKY